MAEVFTDLQLEVIGTALKEFIKPRDDLIEELTLKVERLIQTLSSSSDSIKEALAQRDAVFDKKLGELETKWWDSIAPKLEAGAKVKSITTRRDGNGNLIADVIEY